MNKEKLKKELLAEAEKMIDAKLENIKNSSVPEKGKTIFFIESCSLVRDKFWDETNADYCRLYHGNVFYNRKECDKYNEIDKQLHKLAWELNQKKPVDWDNFDQRKYYLSCDFKERKTFQGYNNHCKSNKLYCTDINFIDKAVELIGENNLDWYIQR